VQRKVGQVGEVDAVRRFCRAGHDQVGHVGRQNGGGQLERTEADCQRQADPPPGAFRQPGLIRKRHDDRHQQRDAAHVGRHDEREGIGQQHHTADQAGPGTGQVRGEQARGAVGQPDLADGDAQHEAAQHEPEGGRQETGKHQVGRRDVQHHRDRKEQQRDQVLRKPRRSPQRDGSCRQRGR